MKLKTVILRNFRSYKQEIRINFENITTIIGKNDIGKSTILEALEIFFNNETIKIDSKDICVEAKDSLVSIGCVFEDLPSSVVIDAVQTTNLRDEYLLNEDGNLEIYKVYDCSKKNISPSIFVKAMHPSNELVKNLLLSKISDLRTKLRSLGIEEENLDLRASANIRQAIWRKINQPLNLQPTLIPLDKEDAKNIWDSLKKELPSFALFQADRASRDDDNEVQDPMKLAVNEALKMVENELDKIKIKIQEEATKVAELTLSKLKEMDEKLADELVPRFKEEPKWGNIFKLSLDGDNQIPINKRGSGVRRLILLNFFRAQAEDRKQSKGLQNIIYAIEEPETSQHPNNQKMLIEALMDLAESENCQVILTTHVPEIAGMVPVDSVRYIEKDANGEKIIKEGDDAVYAKIANDLGILPDKRVQVIVCVEGYHDINFLNHISSIMNQQNKMIPNLAEDSRVVILPLGGSSLKQWVHGKYLRGFGLPEVHIFDRDISVPPKYEIACNLVNTKGDGSWATLTGKREMENYIHPEVINNYFGINVNFTDVDDVPNLVKDAINSCAENKFAPIKEDRVKKILNNKVIKEMTYIQIQQVDPGKNIESWLKKIASYLH